MLNVPNALTLFRILLVPVMVAVFYLPWDYARLTASGLFILASLTDWLDGWLARKLGQSTPFGAFIDPVADKLMVVCALSLLIEAFHAIWYTIPAIIIICRELLVSALREWMAGYGKRDIVRVSAVGKWKTTFQMLAIIVLLACGPLLPQFTQWVGAALLYLATGLTLWSMGLYLKAASAQFSSP